MLDKCCTPKCLTDFDKNCEAYMAVFLFQKDLEKRTKSIKNIHRQSFVLNK